MLFRSEGSDFLVAGVDRHARRVDAQKLAGGVLERHRNQVLTVAAPHLQDAAARERGGVHAEEDGEGGEPVGMGLRERRVRVQHLIVDGGNSPECTAVSGRDRFWRSMTDHKKRWSVPLLVPVFRRSGD